MPYSATEAKELVETLQKQSIDVLMRYPSYGSIVAMLVVGVWRYYHGEIVLAFFAAIPGALIGYRLGRMRSLALKVQAQTLLCLIQAEERSDAKR
jgi:hypothetical protein